MKILSDSQAYSAMNSLKELHICYISLVEIRNVASEFRTMLTMNQVLERVCFSGDAFFEALQQFQAHNGQVVAKEPRG
jgi:hypothetical protein